VVEVRRLLDLIVLKDAYALGQDGEHLLAGRAH